MRRPEINAFVAISPPASSYDFNFLSPCPAQGLIIQGTEDTVVSEADVYALYEKLSKQRNSNVEYIPIDQADHFYTKHMNQYVECLYGYIKPRLNMEQLATRSKRDRRRRQSVSTDDE
jgi:alpha/beta superfamily hydrolase